MIEVKIVADSIGPNGIRITTYQLTYPRCIHSEIMTHRMFSRNASSSRAIPVKKVIEAVRNNPFIPMAFCKNKPGMQAGEALSDEQNDQAKAAWLTARDNAVLMAERLADLEVHKQYANRLLEPFAHITVILTATDYENFFALRYHTAAEPHFQELAKQMYTARENSVPVNLVSGEWHLPFVTKDEINSGVTVPFLIQRSVARCARVSYLNHDGSEPNPTKDYETYQKLVGGFPMHASPAEHQAMATPDPNCRSGNFRGWIQYRKTLPGENVTQFTRPDLTNPE